MFNPLEIRGEACDLVNVLRDLENRETVLIPQENEKDLAEIPASVKEGLEIVPVTHIDEVLARALAEPLQAIEWTDDDEHAAEPPVSPPGAESGVTVRH